MKKILLAFIIAWALTACSSKQTGYPRPAPQTRIHLMNGEYIALSKIPAQTKVLMFWSIDCSISRSKITRLNDLAGEMKGRSDVAFVAVNLDLENKSQAVVNYIRKFNLNNLMHAYSGNAGADETFSAYKTSYKLPQLVVISRGEIMGRSSRVVDVKRLIS